MASPVWLCYAVGVILRYLLANSTFSNWSSERNEISTPLTSWDRVVEGLSLHKAGISPYSGDIFHQMPLMLQFFLRLTTFGGQSIYLIFILTDLFTAILLERVATHYGKFLLLKQKADCPGYHVDASKLLLKAGPTSFTRLYVVAAYMLNPYTIAACTGKTTGVFENLIIVCIFYYTLKASRQKAAFFVALAAYMSLYPIMLIVPASLFLAKAHLGYDLRWGSSKAIKHIIVTSAMCLSFLGGLLYGSYIIQGSWDFIRSTYGFILSVPDQTPNMGVFWYFFTEMFEHFRLFFICVFQINAFIFTVPLAIRLKDHPIFFMYILVALTAIFKSYPSYSDAALYLAMLPLWKHTFSYMRNNILVIGMYVVCTVMAPILYHLWIYAGSANANFYFAISLVYCTAQIFLVTDILYAVLRREYDIHNGLKPMINGKPARVILD